MGIQISQSVKWFFISLSFFLWAGCSTEKEEGTAAESVGRVERVRLSFEGKSSADGQVQSAVQSVSSLAEESKVSFSESNGSFSWQGGESIRVQLSGGTAADGTVDAAGSSSTMTVTVPSGQSRTGFAYYPASIVSTTASSRNLTVTLPDTYDSYAYPYAPTPMIAEQTTESGVSVLDNLRFLHLGGVALLEVKVASDVTANITKIVVAVDKRITGDFTATGSFGGYSIKTDGAASGTTVTYNLASGVAPGGTQKLFLPLPVGTYTINSVRAYGSDGINCIAKSSSATSSFNITRKGGSKFTDSKAIALAKTLEREYNVYEIVYGRGNCIVDSGTASSRSVSFDATPYEAGTNYLYTSTVATPDAAKAPVSAKVLWREGLTADPSASLNTSTYQVTVSGISGTGNCVVGLYNSSNEIIWSFHVWSPGYDPTASANVRTYTGTDSKSYTVMGTALGATACSTAKEATWSYTHCGMYYQWGRKDPLGRVNSSKALSGTAVQSGIVPSTASAGIIAVNNSAIGSATSVADHIAYSIKNPHMFIKNDGNSYAWFSTYTTYTETNANWDNHLWGTLYDGSGTYTEIGKTIFDPCPAGWKVSTTGQVFANCTTSDSDDHTTTKATDASSKGRNVTAPTTDFIAYSGRRYYSSGAVSDLPSVVASGGLYWSSCQSSSSNNYGQDLYATSTGFSPTGGSRRANGLTVRCVRLQN